MLVFSRQRSLSRRNRATKHKHENSEDTYFLPAKALRGCLWKRRRRLQLTGARKGATVAIFVSAISLAESCNRETGQTRRAIRWMSKRKLTSQKSGRAPEILWRSAEDSSSNAQKQPIDFLSEFTNGAPGLRFRALKDRESRQPARRIDTVMYAGSGHFKTGVFGFLPFPWELSPEQVSSRGNRARKATPKPWETGPGSEASWRS